jgi:hypothetical protein
VRVCHTEGGKYVLRMPYPGVRNNTDDCGTRAKEVSSATLPKKLPKGAHPFPQGHYSCKEHAELDASRFRLWVELGFCDPSKLPTFEANQLFADVGERPVSMSLATDAERARRRRRQADEARARKVSKALDRTILVTPTK